MSGQRPLETLFSYPESPDHLLVPLDRLQMPVDGDLLSTDRARKPEPGGPRARIDVFTIVVGRPADRYAINVPPPRILLPQGAEVWAARV